MTREAGIYNEEKTYDVRETGQLHVKKKRIWTFSHTKYKQGERSKSKNKQMGHNLNLKAFAQQRKPSTKWKDNLVNGRKYLQMIWPIKS